MSNNLWRGRMENRMSEIATDYISSIEEDKRILEIDIDLIQAHSLMLFKQGYLDKDKLSMILKSLEKAREDWKNNRLDIKSYMKQGFHDIHPILEKYIIDDCGIEVGGLIHLGKSRNDQVMTDILIYLRDELFFISQELINLIKTIIGIAKRNVKTVMPVYTHSLPAQVSTFAHFLLTHVCAFLRDLERLNEVHLRINKSPLGSCAIAGTSINIDRYYVAELLGFNDIIQHTIDATSSRDNILEFIFIIGIIMNNLSRLSADFIFMSSYESNMIEISDEFTDTSTAMPQKKNPCPLEILRARSKEVNGLINSCLSITTGLSTGYHRDLQEMKLILFKIIDIIKNSIQIMNSIISTIKINRQRMFEIANDSFTTALDLVEYIVENHKISFREANFLVGRIIKELISNRKRFKDLTTEMVKTFSRKIIKKDIIIPPKYLKKITDPNSSIMNKKVTGSPQIKDVKNLIRKCELEIAKLQAEFAKKMKKVASAKDNFKTIIKQYIKN